ncbi:MAG: thioredoxin family protein [Anaerolineae bacterium]|nr:thioredoxin family protein [Anaerolineae bacterium]
MAERIIVFGLFCGVCYLGYLGLMRWQMRQVKRGAPTDPLLADLRPNLPAIVYFTTPVCQVCQFQQTPVIEQLRREAGVQIVHVDAYAQPEIADRWGVLSAPTTFVLDTCGQPCAVNNGLADAQTLRSQLGLTDGDR